MIDETNEAGKVFKKLLIDLKMNPEELKGFVKFIGEDPIIPTVAHAGTISAVTRALPSYISALIWQKKTGEGQDLTIDLRKTLFEMSPFFQGSIKSSINGATFPNSSVIKDVQTTLYKTKDNRWFLPTAMYPKTTTKMMKLLHSPSDYESMQETISQWHSEDLERLFNENDIPGCILRTREEYENSEYGKRIKSRPLIKITRITDGKPEPLKVSERPLDDIKVLGLTHVLAGPTVLRTLAEQGADCVNIWGIDSTELEQLYALANTGIRSTFADLLDRQSRKKFDLMIEDADVFVENLHGELINSLRITPEELSKNSKKGIVYVSLRCYANEGMDSMLPGFDMQAVAKSGYCYEEGTQNQPALPYTRVFNDFTAGFLAAAGAQIALMRRAREGGSYKVEISLARCTEFYNSLGFFNRDYFQKMVGSDTAHTLGTPDTITKQTSLGTYRRLKPEVLMSVTEPYWSNDLLSPRGANNLNWLQ